MNSHDIDIKIKNDNEILQSLPINTKRNRTLFVKKAKEMQDVYQNIKQEILQELYECYHNKIDIDPKNELLERENTQIEEIEKIQNVMSKIKTPYEKMGLDKIILELKRFYKKDIDTVNSYLRKAIELFNKIGVRINEEDFNFTKHTKEYMTELFLQINNNTIDERKLKDLFEKIYWKEPNLILHIQLNFRYIYFKKEKDIINAFLWQEGRVKQKLKMDEEQILTRYNNIQKKIINRYKNDYKNIINNFLNGSWNLKDYEEKNIIKCYNKFIERTENIDQEELDRNIINLLHNLYEYENYMRFKFIFDDMKEIYNQETSKETYKVVKKKIIDKCEKITSKGLFNILNKEKNIDADVQELSELFERLDELEVQEKIKTNLNPTSNLKQMGKVAVAFYKYLFNCMIKNDKDITENEIKTHIEEFEEFVKYPYDTISSSIFMNENKDIPLMIKDRYNLFKINITKELLNTNEIRNLILNFQKIENNIHIHEAKIELNEVSYLLKAKKILEDNFESN